MAWHDPSLCQLGLFQLKSNVHGDCEKESCSVYCRFHLSLVCQLSEEAAQKALSQD